MIGYCTFSRRTPGEGRGTATALIRPSAPASGIRLPDTLEAGFAFKVSGAGLTDLEA
jgi:hypothetical protein